eukprot:g1671.t1
MPSSRSSGRSPERRSDMTSGNNLMTIISASNEIKAGIPLMKKSELFSPEVLLNLFNLAIDWIQKGDLEPSVCEKFVSGKSSSDKKSLVTALVCIWKLLRSILEYADDAMKGSGGVLALKKTLAKVGLPSSLTTHICKYIAANRVALRTNTSLGALRTRFPSLKNIKWRVDVVISSSALKKFLFPCVTFQLTLSSGTISTFEVPLPVFHQLRLSIAKLLRDMQAMEVKPISRILNHVESVQQIRDDKESKRL